MKNKEVCLCIYALYKAVQNLEVELNPGQIIDVTELSNEDESQWYYDLKDAGNVLCLDGENCEILEENSNYVKLRNTNGEIDAIFELNRQAFNVAAYG